MHTKRYSIASLAVVGLFAAWFAIAGAADKAAPAEAALGEPAPAFTLEDQDGKKVGLSDFKDRIVVLEWINPTCPFVVRHYKAGTMADLARKYGDQVTWLAINSTTGQGSEVNRKWVQEYKLPYPILTDPTGATGHAYGATNTPHLYIIDSAGKLAYRGAIDDDPRGSKSDRVNYVDKALGELTAGKTVSTPETKAYGCSVKYAK